MCISNSNYFAESFFIPVAAPYLIILAMFYHESIRDFRRKDLVEFFWNRFHFVFGLFADLVPEPNDMIPD